MIKPEIRDSVRTLRAQGHSLREISRLLHLARNTVRSILRQPEAAANEVPQIDPRILEHLSGAFRQARGNVVRAQQLLAAEGLDIPYSSLTRWVRQAGLREPPPRSGEFCFPPASEMQHDTSPHRVTLAGRTVSAQCAGLILAYSRRLFIQYHPNFRRLEAKHFLLEAARFNDGTASVCIIDNTSVMLAGGAGANAIIAPEMAAFARTLGFEFRAHRVRDPNRKGRIERNFAYIEANFLAGRQFSDFDDLNRQALAWCCEVANQKLKRALGMSAEAAYLIEKPRLHRLPSVLPPVYAPLEREVDLYGYVSVDTNRYSVPERLVGQTVTVHKYLNEIQIWRRGTLIATHVRCIGERDRRRTLPEHHPTLNRAKPGPTLEEQLLRGEHPSLERYAVALKQRARGGGLRALRRLLELKRTYPIEPFLLAIEQALHYGLFDLGRLESLILHYVAGDFFALRAETDDDA